MIRVLFAAVLAATLPAAVAGSWGPAPRVLVSTPASPPQPWHTDYAVARAESEATGKPLLIFFTMTGCAPCRQMEHLFLGEPETLSRCVLLKLKDKAARTPPFNVQSYPLLLVYAPDGTQLLNFRGLMRADYFRTRLAAVAPPAATRAPLVEQAEPENFGVDLSKLGKGSAYRVNHNGQDREVRQAEAIDLIQNGLPDDTGKHRLTFIGEDGPRKAAMEAFGADPANAPVLSQLIVQGFKPDAWQVKDGFVKPDAGKVMVYLQQASPPTAKAAKVLYRDLYAADAHEAVRAAVPGYDPKKDPGRKSAAPANPVSPEAMGQLAVLAAGAGLLVYLLRK